MWTLRVGCPSVAATLLLLPAFGSVAHADPPRAQTSMVQQTAEQRIGGTDRYGVSANVSRWLPHQDATRVIVASGEVFADALSAGPLASKLGGRLLLTRGSQLSDAARAELLRRRPSEIILTGGTGAVSAKVAAQLSAFAHVTRIGGQDRYAVAAAIADRIKAKDVVIASGEVFADALAAGPLAAELGASLLLSAKDALPRDTAEALRRIAPRSVIVVGGPGAISDRVLDQIGEVTGTKTVRIGGRDRYEVAANVAAQYFRYADTALLVSGATFPDGLSGTPLAHAYRAPILLSTGSCPPAATVQVLARLKALTHRIYVGGPSAVASSPYACGTPGVRAGLNPPKADLKGIIPAGTPGEEAIYFVPHQDDELISMAGGIVRDVREGRRVHVFLVNAGDWTGARDALCARQKVCLTGDQVTASRNAEFLTSLEALGVPSGNVHFLYTREQQKDAAQAVENAVSSIVAQAGPEAQYRSISWLDAHPGHYRLAYAVRNACSAAGLRHCLFFQSPLYQKRSEALGYLPVPTPIGRDYPIGSTQVDKAVAAYRLNSPADGRFAIGWQSVQSQISWIGRYDASWGHGMTWANLGDESTAADWITLHQHGPGSGPDAGVSAHGLLVPEIGEPDPNGARRRG